MTAKDYKYLVRLPIQLREQLQESAELYRRSLNSDIVARLEQSFGAIIGAAMPEPSQSLHVQLRDVLHRDLSHDEQQLVRRFRSLTDAKRSALMDLLS